MVTRLRSLLAVLLIIGLSVQAAWSMAPACETEGSVAHQSIVSIGAGAGAESPDGAFEATEECERMLLRCPAAVLPGTVPQVASSTPGESFDGVPVPVILFLTDGPKRPPRSS